MNDARDKLNLHFSMLGLKGAPFFYFPVFQHFIIYNHSIYFCKDQVQHWYYINKSDTRMIRVFMVLFCRIQSWTSLNIFETNLWRLMFFFVMSWDLKKWSFTTRSNNNIQDKASTSSSIQITSLLSFCGGQNFVSFYSM